MVKIPVKIITRMYLITVRTAQVKRVKTLQIGNKLIILNGVDPLRYVNLVTNKVHQYKEQKI